MIGAMKARTGVVSHCLTRTMSRFFTVNVQTWLMKPAMMAEEVRRVPGLVTP